MPTPPITSLAQLDPNGTYTYADYLRWQFEGWEELLHGRLLPAPTYDEPHQRTAGELLLHLHPAARAAGGRCLLRTSVAFAAPGTAGMAPADFTSVVMPDLAIISGAARLDKQGCLGPPELITEVTAPGSNVRDWKAKYDLYEANGVPEYWIVSPGEALLAVFVLDAATARYRLVGEYVGPGPVPCATLPGLVLDWADVFPDAEGA